MSVQMATTRQVLEPKQGGDITYTDMVDEQELGESQIQKLFVGATVFVTGGTGFIGKLLIEKLLRSCPDIKRIYVLIRPKRNKSPAQRLEQQFSDVIYKRLTLEQPHFIEKIAIVEGDISKLDLGISEIDRRMLENEVDIIFHGAATVKFIEPLKSIVEMNVRGTRDIFLLARACTKLKAMVHISTAYSNCTQSDIEEKFYDRKLSGDKLIYLVESIDEKMIDKITPDLLGDYPNTYTYSKSAGEDIVREYSKGLPVAVCRPSMVVGTATEPISGWIDNVNGPTGIVVGAGLGVLHVVCCTSERVMDIIPGDMVVNCCIAVAWKVAKDNVTNYEDALLPELPPPIYNITSGSRNSLKVGELVEYIETNGPALASAKGVWYPFLILTTSKFLHAIISLLTHWIPAYILDALAVLVGRKPMLKKVYTKIGIYYEVITYFINNDWKFHDDNCSNLYNEMCEADKQIFDFNITNVDWEEFITNFLCGLRVYYVKDPIETLPQGQKKFLILKIAHYFICTIFVIIILYLVWYFVRFLF